MMVFAHSAYHAARHIIFKVAVEGLVLAVLNFKIGEVAAAVLGGQRTFLHI